MTADSGYITLTFSGTEEELAALARLCDGADRRNEYSCGLSWLDELDSEGRVESEAVSYDTLECTREFLSWVLESLPGLEIEGRIEHCWPVLPLRQTVAEFSAEGGALLWRESEQAVETDPFPFLTEDEEEEAEEEWEYPTEP